MNKLAKYVSKRNTAVLVCAAGTVGIALKFPSYFNHWVYFPAFPNILDSAFLIASAVTLCYFALRRNKNA